MFVQRQEYTDGRSVSERSSYHHAPAFVQSHCSALHHVPYPAIKEGAHVEHEVAFIVFEHQERTQRPSLCVRPMRGGPLRVEMPSPPTAVQLTHTALDLRREAPRGIEAIGGGVPYRSFSPRMVSASCKKESHVIEIIM